MVCVVNDSYSYAVLIISLSHLNDKINVRSKFRVLPYLEIHKNLRTNHPSFFVQ